MEKQLRCVLMLPLQDIVLRKVAVILWNQSDVLDLIGKSQFEYGMFNEIKWRETVECKVSDKLTKLQLPNVITKKIMQILKSIGLQIKRWKLFHASFLSDSKEYLDLHILEKLCFTTAGTVDYQKTAEAIVRSNVIDTVKLYKLACLYCLDDYIPEFWRELPEKEKLFFHNVKDTTPIEEPRLWFCWPYIIKGEESKLDRVCGSRSLGSQSTFRQYAFECLAITGNKAAVEYFLQRLTQEELEVSLVRAAQGILANKNMEMYSYPDVFPRDKVQEVLCYLLSLMTSEKQMQIFKENPLRVLTCFVRWPWQDLFLDIADVIWTFLPETNYNYLLWLTTKSLRDSGYYFPNLFQSFFLRSPVEFRKYFVNDECRAVELFHECFNNEDTETIKIVFRNVDSADRVRLLTSYRFIILFYEYISEGKWQMVELCLREVALSKEDKEKMKRDFMEFVGNTMQRTPEWRRFFQFLDATDESAQSKRSSDDETLSEAEELYFEKEENSTK